MNEIYSLPFSFPLPSSILPLLFPPSLPPFLPFSFIHSLIILSTLQTFIKLSVMTASLFVESLWGTRHHGSRIMKMIKNERKLTLTECLACIRHHARLFLYIILRSLQQPYTIIIFTPFNREESEILRGQVECPRSHLERPVKVKLRCRKNSLNHSWCCSTTLLSQSKWAIFKIWIMSINWYVWINNRHCSCE